MTPRTIENKFSQELINQSQTRLSKDLSLEGAVMEKIHPKVLWAQLQLAEDPALTLPEIKIDDWFYDCFKNSDEARRAYPEKTEVALGHPWRISQILELNIQDAVIEFPPLGTVVLSKSPLKNLGNNPTLPLWLQYALGPELWGEEGKWKRFHLRLHELFTKNDLLHGADLPGYYPLKNKIKESIESFGYTGTNLGKDYLVVLPWTFSLTDLENIEKIVREL